MRMNQLLRIVRYPALLAGSMAMVTTPAAAANRGGQLTLSFAQTVTNTCNGLTVSGTGKATIEVAAGPNGQGVLVSVSYSPEVFTDANSGSYVETGLGVGAFSAQTAPGHTYTIPLVLKFKGQDGASSFSILTDEIVTINENQAPTLLYAPGVSGSCGL